MPQLDIYILSMLVIGTCFLVIYIYIVNSLLVLLNIFLVLNLRILKLYFEKKKLNIYLVFLKHKQVKTIFFNLVNYYKDLLFMYVTVLISFDFIDLKIMQNFIYDKFNNFFFNDILRISLIYKKK